MEAAKCLRQAALLLLLALVAVVQCRPQELLQPKWNWEAVILSRNGPSTSTTPRPSTTWSTTTLRSFDVDPIVGRGQATVEDARLVPRRRGQQRDRYQVPSAGSKTASASYVPAAAMTI